MIKCGHCENFTALSPDGARSIGWRIYEGPSMTGKPMSDVLCPVCSGRGDDPKRPTWNIYCTTCDWQYLEEPDWTDLRIPILTAEEASKLAQEHECEPWFKFTDPQGNTYEGENELYKRRIWPKKMSKKLNELDQDPLPLEE